MFRDAIYTSMRPSLEATMKFGQFGCSNITRTEDAAQVRVRPVKGAHPRQVAPRPRAAGFAAFLYVRSQCEK